MMTLQGVLISCRTFLRNLSCADIFSSAAVFSTSLRACWICLAVSVEFV
jgi:hypothetical protein